MDAFLHIALSFPPVLFSALLVLVVIYWFFVILGVLDLDLFDFDLDLDLDVDLDLDADVAVDGALEGGSKALAAIFSALSLGRVPVTISLSILTLYAWILSFSGTYWLTNSLGAAPGFLLRSGLFLASLFVATAAAGLTVRPLRGLFETTTRRGQETLIGKVCVVTTGQVSDSFGQATLEDGGAGLNLSIRCDTEDNGIKRGDKVLIIGYDNEHSYYLVEPYESLMG